MSPSYSVCECVNVGMFVGWLWLCVLIVAAAVAVCMYVCGCVGHRVAVCGCVGHHVAVCVCVCVTLCVHSGALHFKTIQSQTTQASVE